MRDDPILTSPNHWCVLQLSCYHNLRAKCAAGEAWRPFPFWGFLARLAFNRLFHHCLDHTVTIPFGARNGGPPIHWLSHLVRDAAFRLKLGKRRLISESTPPFIISKPSHQYHHTHLHLGKTSNAAASWTTPPKLSISRLTSQTNFFHTRMFDNLPSQSHWQSVLERESYDAG